MPRIVTIFALLLLCAWGGGVAAQDAVRVEGGLVSGTLSEDGDMRIFRGIPFAAPPVGALRWRAPQPVLPWQEVRKADTPPPICMQARPKGVSVFSYPEQATETISEDCLYLDLWAPVMEKNAAKLPVMVWLYGGGFTGGSLGNPLYDGSNLAEKGAIVVVANYRTGKLGFLALKELSDESGHHASGNYGLLDQIATLEWVKKNIARFGGDPSRVTIFGQSAGSFAVSLLMGSPAAKGLFQRAIGESGAQFGPVVDEPVPGAMQRLAGAEKSGLALEQALGVSSLAELRAKPAEAIQAARGPSPWAWSYPIVDGYVVPDDLNAIFAAGKQNDVPLLTGSNADEGTTFGRPTTLAAYLDTTEKEYGSAADALLRLYPATDNDEATEMNEDVARDRGFAWHNWQWARLARAHGKSKVSSILSPMRRLSRPARASAPRRRRRWAPITGRRSPMSSTISKSVTGRGSRRMSGSPT